MKEVTIISKIVGRGTKNEPVSASGGASVTVTGGGVDKALFDKLFEVRTDSQGTEYLLVKLSLVSQLGITAYADKEGLDVESIYAALPIDGVTIYWEDGVLKAVASGGGGVADSVAWEDVTGKPSFAKVATSGKYSDLIGLPSFALVATSGKYSDLNGLPSFALVATTGKYSDLNGLPTIPTNTNQLTNGAGFVTSSALNSYLLKSSYTAADVLSKIKTVDGNGSGLDADTLDGRHFNELLMEDITIYGNLTVTGGITAYSTNGQAVPFLIDATNWENLTSSSTIRVYTARAVSLLKAKLAEAVTELATVKTKANANETKLNAIKSALSGISSSSSASAIGAALNTIYKNL